MLLTLYSPLRYPLVPLHHQSLPSLVPLEDRWKRNDAIDGGRKSPHPEARREVSLTASASALSADEAAIFLEATTTISLVAFLSTTPTALDRDSARKSASELNLIAPSRGGHQALEIFVLKVHLCVSCLCCSVDCCGSRLAHTFDTSTSQIHKSMQSVGNWLGFIWRGEANQVGVVRDISAVGALWILLHFDRWGTSLNGIVFCETDFP
ncbi:putative pre-mRNA-processing factor 39-like [Sesbania bispinosa]|nr:putative pre-mRNA-processing factor 39-like [Sesbania bispinosa]